jgi:hypothetical protein
MKFFLFFFLIFCVSVNAATISYSQTEFIYQPVKTIELPFTIKNPEQKQATLNLNVDAGDLTPYISYIPGKFTLASKENAKMSIKLTPNNLPQGIYPISVSVSESAGMARSGAKTTFNIINPFENGHPHLDLKLLSKKENTIDFMINIKNIGLTELIETPKIELRETGKIVFSKDLEIIRAAPFEKKTISHSIPLQNIPFGSYELTVKLGNAEISELVSVGHVIASVDKEFTLRSNEMNDVVIPLKIEWNRPFDAEIYLTASDGKRKLFFMTFNKTLAPGINNLEISIPVSRAWTDGEHKALIRSSGKTEFKAEFPIFVKEADPKTLIGKSFESDDYNLETPKKSNKQKIFIIALLAIGGLFLLIFAFLHNENKQTT